MIELLKTYDWQEAFAYAGEKSSYGAADIRGAHPGIAYNLAPFTRDDVDLIAGMSEGENDAASWLMWGRLKDGRWFYLEAWCDYTGWDCQAGGSATIAQSAEDCIRFAMTDEARGRFGAHCEVNA